MPGIENFAPERTLTSSGSEWSPSFLPIEPSSVCRWVSTSSIIPSGKPPPARYVRQASVETVNPCGTGSPMFVISARLAPFPPRSSFMSLLPSLKS